MVARALRHNSETYSRNSFLSQLEVKHGPVAMLGRFFLKADAEMRARGLSLEFASLEELVATNEANGDSWRPLLPIFDGRFFDATPENAFCIIGRDRSGRIVATHAARLYDFRHTNFYEEATSLRLFYRDPDRMKLSGEAYEITAPSTHTVTGLTIFSGAAWYHPDFRGSSLSKILPRVGKAYALTRWPAATIVSFMAEEIHAKGFASRFGYENVDWAVFMKNSRVGTLRAAFLSVSRGRAFDYVGQFLGDSGTKVDAAVLRRPA